MLLLYTLSVLHRISYFYDSPYISSKRITYKHKYYKYSLSLLRDKCIIVVCSMDQCSKLICFKQTFKLPQQAQGASMFVDSSSSWQILHNASFRRKNPPFTSIFWDESCTVSMPMKHLIVNTFWYQKHLHKWISNPIAICNTIC